MSDWITAIAAVLAVPIAIGALWVAILARLDSKRLTERANDLTEATNRIGAESVNVANDAKRIAGRANELAEAANAISADSRGIAEGANALATEANTLAVKANLLAAESNGIAAEALQVSRESAISARESASAASASADHERSALQMQRDERHERCRPALPARLDVQVKRGGPNSEFYYAELELDDDYRVEATTFTGNSSSRTPMDALVRKGAKTQVFIEHIAPGQDGVRAERIKFRFWPPVETDGVDTWTCGCGAPELPDGGRGHWEREVPLYRPPMQRAVSPITERLPRTEPYGF